MEKKKRKVFLLSNCSMCDFFQKGEIVVYCSRTASTINTLQLGCVKEVYPSYCVMTVLPTQNWKRWTQQANLYTTTFDTLDFVQGYVQHYRGDQNSTNCFPVHSKDAEELSIASVNFAKYSEIERNDYRLGSGVTWFAQKDSNNVASLAGVGGCNRV